MAKTAMIRARTNNDLKEEVETIFKELGLSASEAINLFYNQVRLNKGIPFMVKIPNEITEETFKATDEGKNLVKCKDEKDMFKKLGI